MIIVPVLYNKKHQQHAQNSSGGGSSVYAPSSGAANSVNQPVMVSVDSADVTMENMTLNLNLEKPAIFTASAVLFSSGHSNQSVSFTQQLFHIDRDLGKYDKSGNSGVVFSDLQANPISAELIPNMLENSKTQSRASSVSSLHSISSSRDVCNSVVTPGSPKKSQAASWKRLPHASPSSEHSKGGLGSSKCRLSTDNMLGTLSALVLYSIAVYSS